MSYIKLYPYDIIMSNICAQHTMKITLFYIFVAEIAFLFSVFALVHLIEGSVAFRDFSSCMSWNWTTVPPSCQSITHHFPFFSIDSNMFWFLLFFISSPVHHNPTRFFCSQSNLLSTYAQSHYMHTHTILSNSSKKIVSGIISTDKSLFPEVLNKQE